MAQPPPSAAPAAPAAPAPPATPHGRARPLRAGVGLLTPLLWVLLAALASLGALAYAARWMLLTEEGTAWLVGHLPMVTEVRGLRGAVLGPQWRVERLRVQWDGGRQWLVLQDLQSEGMAWQWRPQGTGLFAAWQIERLRVRRLQVETGPPGPRPIPLPAHLAPPLRLVLHELAIGELRIDALEPVTELVASELVFDGQEGAAHGVERLAGQLAGVQLEAKARVANTRPFALQGSAIVVPALQVDVDAPPWAAVVRAEGPLAAFELKGTLRGRPAPRAAPRASPRAASRNAPRASTGAAAENLAPALDLQALVRPLEAWPVRQLDARTEALDLSALRVGAPQTQLAGELQVQAAARNAPVLVQGRLANRAPGRWNEGRLPAARVDVELRGELARPDRVELTRFDLHLADAAGAGLADGNAGRIEGRAEWRGTKLTLEARLHGLQPQRLDGRAPATALAGPLQLQFNGLPSPDPRAPRQAAAPPWSASGRVDLEGRAEGSPRAVTLRAEGSANPSGLELRHLQVSSGEAQAVMRLALARSATSKEWTLATQGSLAEFDPLLWWPGEPASAWRQGPHRLNAGWQFELRAPGEAAQLAAKSPLALLQRLAGNGALRLHDSVLAGVPLEATVTLAYNPVTVPNPGRLHAEGVFGGNRFLLDGEGDPAAGGTAAGRADRWRAEVRAATLAALAPLARLHPSLASWVPRRGSLELDATAAGRWPHVASEGQLRGEALQAGTLALARARVAWRADVTESAGIRAPLAFELQGTGLELDGRKVQDLRAGLQGSLAEHRIEMRATLPVEPGAAAQKVLDISTRGGTQAHLLAQGQWLPDAGGGGRWAARVEQLSVGAAADAADPAGTADTAAAPAQPTHWAQAQDLRAQLQFDAQGRLMLASAEPGRVRVADAFALRWDAVQVDLQRQQADFALRADVEPFALPPLLRRLYPAIDWQGDLRLAARIDVRAAEKFDADLVFQRHDGDLHVQTQGELHLLGLSAFRLQLKAHDGRWEFEPTFVGRGLGEIRGALRLRTGAERRWPDGEAAVEGQIQARVPDIGIWSPWVPPGWRLTGELATTAQLGGRFDAPTYTGEISGKGLGVRNLLQGVSVTDGRLLVRLAGSSAVIDTFTLRGGDGKVDVTGSADLGPSPTAQLKLQAEKFRVLGRVDRLLTASGQAELALASDSSALKGRFGIDEGLFDFTRADAPSLDEDVSLVGVDTRPTTASGTDAAGNARGRQRFVVDVDVGLGEHLRAKGRGLDTGLRGAVRITNPGGRLAVRGAIESVGGTYAAYGQKLELEHGVITFSGPPDNPWLDISAVRPNMDIRVGVLVSGPLQGLRVRLFSDPEMGETDKLSWLVLGRASDGLGRNDTAVLQRAAVALLAGEGEAPTDAFMKRLGIDELSFKQSDGDVRETVVSLGKQLSRRWYVGYERGVNATTGTWQLIYRAAQRFTLRAQSGFENSLDLIWTWRLQQPPLEGGVRKSLPAAP